VALLSGDASDSLVRTDRYRGAFGPLSRDASQVTYTDITGLVDGVLGNMQEQVKGEPVAKAILDDLAGLVRGAGTVVETSRAEGLQLIHESWRQQSDASADTPCVTACGNVPPSRELLDYVPADAWSFHMSSGFDLRPIYAWLLDRFKAYVPKAGDKLLAFNALLAAVDVDIERDILSWVGSPWVLMTMPARSDAPGAADDWLWICKLRDPAGARKMLDRVAAVYAVTVPEILARLQEEMGGSPFVPRVQVGPSEGAYPMLTTAHVVMVQPFSVTFGLLGDLLVVTSSDATLTSALAVAAGEAPGLEDNEPLQQVGGLPDGPLYSASLMPYARDHAQALVEMSQVTGALDMGLSLALGPAARKDPRVAAISRAVHGVLGRVVEIMRASDFRHHGVAWSRGGPDGQGRYRRDTTLFKSREEREALLVQGGH
jgi:hypothetical protein